jgi:hypothetical protein
VVGDGEEGSGGGIAVATEDLAQEFVMFADFGFEANDATFAGLVHAAGEEGADGGLEGAGGVAVAGEFPDEAVELEVFVEEVGEVVAGGGEGEAGVLIAEEGGPFVGQAEGGPADDFRFEDAAKLADGVEFFEGEIDDGVAAVDAAGNEAAPFEVLERLADRDGTDAEADGEITFDEAGAGDVEAGDDLAFESGGDLVAEGFGLGRGGCRVSHIRVEPLLRYI